MRLAATVPILALKLVRVYKLIVSPWLPAACRFTPTCSEYASAAIKEFGPVRGVGGPPAGCFDVILCTAVDSIP